MLLQAGLIANDESFTLKQTYLAHLWLFPTSLVPAAFQHSSRCSSPGEYKQVDNRHHPDKHTERYDGRKVISGSWVSRWWPSCSVYDAVTSLANEWTRCHSGRWCASINTNSRCASWEIYSGAAPGWTGRTRLQVLPRDLLSLWYEGKVNVKVKWIYITPSRETSQALRHYTVYSHCLPLPCKRSPDGATIDWWWRPSNCSLLLIYRPWKDERVSWLTYSGRFANISGTRQQ